jgi:type I restriction enzyme, S subunit
MELTKTKFKQTEVGLIPEDWIQKKLGDIGDVQMCKRIFSYETSKRGDVPFYKIGTFGNEPDAFISRELYEEFRKKYSHPKTGCLLISASGTIGRTVEYRGEDAYYQDSNIIWLDNNETLVTNQYLKYILSVIKYNTEGSTIKRLYNSIIKSSKFPLPPTLTEQKAIATALSDVDELIAKLEKLIEKKKAIKQGAMQQLLMPQKGWIKKRISEIAEVGRGRVISHKEINSSINNSYPVYSSQTSNDGVMGYIGTFDFEGEYVTWTTDGVNAGTVFYRNGKFNCTNVCGTLKLRRDNPKFIAVCLNEITPKFVSKNLANPKLMNDVMKKIELVIPENINEQNLIAEKFSFIDTELESLNKKHMKLLAVKQGMMQELLTGRTRLI